MKRIRTVFADKIGKPMLALLRQGTSPDRLAASVALGAVVGIFPLVGVTTAACAALALLLRLNLPAIQLANYLVYPLQLVLLIPFIHLGSAFFQAPVPSLSLQELTALFEENFWAAIASFFAAFARAAVVWVGVSIPAFAAVFFSLVFFFRRIGRRRTVEAAVFRG